MKKKSKNSIWVYPHTVIIYAWIFIATFVLGLVAIGVSYFSKTGNSVHRVAQIWGSSILWISGIKVHISGMENIDPTQSAIYMSNHQSNFDIPVFFGALPIQFRWVAKAELFKIPIFGQGMRGAGYISIDRSDTRSAIKSLKRAVEKIRNGTSVLFFPEGTRSNDGALLSFKKGGFIMAVEANVPIVPMAVSGTYQVMPKGSKLIHRRLAYLVIQPPIDTSPYTRKNHDDLMQHVRDAIGDALRKGQERGDCA